ncbi:hypothetical protein CFK37_15070 [Virgibacillus phasianinus]|uniref:Uncharacterized protein n=1 Tax=Virgibacillus phasianinus TaxID=2017483 RepID=A0A220U6N7_9BACI|nr:hypothetical protein [Virgibacillus phasianinus]ASK63383.1 hypothetical protein CFK37_15070 [Virgibacillus phasianinus]
MKTLVLTTAGVMLIAGSVFGTNVIQEEGSNHESLKTGVSQISQGHNSPFEIDTWNQKADFVDDNTHVEDKEGNSYAVENEVEFPEFIIIDELINANSYQIQIVANNSHKRIIILKDEDGQPQYKSIYIKDINQLKIIEFDQGMVFKGDIGKYSG